MEGNTAINKQTKRITFMELDRSLTIRQFEYLPGDQKIDSENTVGGIYAWTAGKKTFANKVPDMAYFAAKHLGPII